MAFHNATTEIPVSNHSAAVLPVDGHGIHGLV